MVSKLPFDEAEVERSVMVALLVVVTFAIFITVDVLLHREKYQFRVAVETEAAPSHTPIVAGVTLPEVMAYHPAHTWALDEGSGRIRAGLDEFAASLLGTIRSIEVPKRGRWLRQGDRGWVIRTDRGEVAMLAPAEGEVVAVNDKAVADPEILASDPYGAGWLVEMRTPDAEGSFRNLLSGALARHWMTDSMAALCQSLSPAALVTAQDGGRIAPRLGDELAPEVWKNLTQEFFRCV